MASLNDNGVPLVSQAITVTTARAIGGLRAWQRSHACNDANQHSLIPESRCVRTLFGFSHRDEPAPLRRLASDSHVAPFPPLFLPVECAVAGSGTACGKVMIGPRPYEANPKAFTSMIRQRTEFVSSNTGHHESNRRCGWDPLMPACDCDLIAAKALSLSCTRSPQREEPDGVHT